MELNMLILIKSVIWKSFQIDIMHDYQPFEFETKIFAGN